MYVTRLKVAQNQAREVSREVSRELSRELSLELSCELKISQKLESIRQKEVAMTATSGAYLPPFIQNCQIFFHNLQAQIPFHNLIQ